MGEGLARGLCLDVEIEKRLREFSLDLKFEAGSGCLGILGASGSGKSMALKAIAGIIKPDRGRIAMRRSGEAEKARVFYDSALKINEKPQARRVGYLFQNYALFPNMTVEENIAAGLNAARGRGLSGRRFFCRSANGTGARVREMVNRFRLEGLEKRYPAQLSGGQQQRVALARILAYEPEVILLDEPFSAMDSYLREGLRLELARALLDYHGIAVMVTHDRDEAYQLCDRLLLLDQGRVLTGGRTREVFQSPGTCQAARLTGCKNISRIRRLGGRRIAALDWNNIELSANRIVDDSVTAVGIRAHDFQALSEAEAAGWRDSEHGNLIRVRSTRISEMPFEWYVTLDNGLWWKKEKDIHTHDAAGIAPPWLRVDPSALLLLTGEPN